MAFWKRLGKNRTVPNDSSSNNIKSSKNFKLQNNNDSINHSTSHLSTSGDLGESLFNSLQQLSPVEERMPPFPSKHKSQNDNMNNDFGDLSDFNAPETIRTWSRRSRLSKNLAEVLSDHSALSHFQQFLESRQASSYLTLLNDVKNYHLLAASFASVSTSSCSINTNSPLLTNGDGPTGERRGSSPFKTGVLRLLNSTSSSSGFSDDTSSLDSPGHRAHRPSETDTTIVHSLLNERRRIVQKYFDPDSSEYLPSVAGFLRESNDSTDNSMTDSLTVDCAMDIFYDVQIGVYNLLENQYFAEYTHSEYHYRYQLELITGGKLIITDILHNDTCLFYFMEFMDQEGKRHWLEFWLAADNYRSQWNASNAPSDALIIYNKYFSLQATTPLGLADTIRSSIEENICMTNTGPGPDCFECSLHVLLCAMEKKYLQSFLSSPVFCQFLNEILSALKNTSSLPLSRSKRTGSSSTLNSEISGVSSSTVSAATSSQAGSSSTFASGALISSTENSMIRLGNSISNESLLIDLRQLNNPDSLWMRKKTTLCLGRLTAFGRYCSEVEPLPERKSGSKLSKAVRKFVFIGEDEEKEEAAWKVAEMIVRDVMAITFDNGDLTVDADLCATSSHVPANDVV